MSGHRVLPMPTNHVYTASKFAVTAITQGIRNELLAEQPDLLCRVSVSVMLTRNCRINDLI